MREDPPAWPCLDLVSLPICRPMPSNSCVAEPFAVHAGSIAQLHGRVGIVRNRCSTFMHRGVGACTPSAAHRLLFEPNVLPRLWTRTRGAGWLRGETCCTSAGRRHARHVQQLAVVGSASTRRADGRTAWVGSLEGLNAGVTLPAARPNIFVGRPIAAPHRRPDRALGEGRWCGTPDSCVRLRGQGSRRTVADPARNLLLRLLQSQAHHRCRVP